MYVCVCVCMMPHSCFTHLHCCFKQIDMFTEHCMKKKSFSNLYIFSWTNSLFALSKHTPYRKLFPPMYNMSGPVSIYSLTKQMSIDSPERLTKS